MVPGGEDGESLQNGHEAALGSEPTMAVSVEADLQESGRSTGTCVLTVVPGSNCLGP